MELRVVLTFIIYLLFHITLELQSISLATTPSCEYESMTLFLHQLAANYSKIARLVSIGKTLEDREIWTMIVSDSPYNRPLLRPQVKFVGNVNGMSGPACYVLLRLTQQFLQEFESEGTMERKLMENMEIHIIPNLNPDGYARAKPGSCFGGDGRLNANNVNLNTNFPDIFIPVEQWPRMEKETEALKSWMQKNKFTVSVSVISGAQVVVYPFDTIILRDFSDIPNGNEPHLTPDNEIFKHLSLTYAKATGAPAEGWYCPVLERSFPQGIVNGAEWNPQSGTMMDFNYFEGTFELMVGISCCRNEVNETVLNNLWWKNREGLLHVIHEVDGGIRGQVLDAETYDAIPEAELSKKPHDLLEGEDEFSMPWYTTLDGEFWRPWRPGIYQLKVVKQGYITAHVMVEVKQRQPTFIRVEMEKVGATKRPKTTTTPVESYKSIKKITTLHDESFYEATTPGSSDVVTQTNEEEAPAEIDKSYRHYSPLTHLDNSFINLFRGIQLRNCGNINDWRAHSIDIPILLLGFLLRYFQVAEN